MKFIKADGLWWKYIELDKNKDRIIVENYLEERKTINGINHEIIERKDWHSLNWKDSKLVDDSYKTGWLSPEGKFFGCAYYLHSMQATFILKKTELELENEGWCRISNDYLTDKPSIIFDYKNFTRKPTLKQIDYLNCYGYDTYELIKECFLVDKNNFDIER